MRLRLDPGAGGLSPVVQRVRVGDVERIRAAAAEIADRAAVLAEHQDRRPEGELGVDHDAVVTVDDPLGEAERVPVPADHRLGVAAAQHRVEPGRL